MSNNNIINNNKETPSSIEIIKQPGDDMQGGQVLNPATDGKTRISARLDEALEQMKRVNRSADLVPLKHDYDVMKKELRTLLALTKTYKSSMLAMDKARTEMVTKMGAMSANTPIYGPIGDTVTGASFASTLQAASRITHSMDSVYQDRIVDYCSDWERVVTNRADKGIKETMKLREKLLHYEKKVEVLRRNVNRKEEAGKSVSTKLKEKLARNETKLTNAWKSHESSASMLCNLLEQVTKRGWKDLAPLILNYIQWEVDRASETFVTFSRLPAISVTLLDTVGKASVPYTNEENSVAVALVSEETVTGSDTASLDPSNPDDASVMSVVSF